MKKKYNCNQLSIKNVNEDIILHGFVNKIRNLGKISFIELRDFYGNVQLVMDNKKINKTIRNEFIIEIEGKVLFKKNSNNKEIEVNVNKLTVISESNLTPFLIKDDTDGLEPLRLKHRYLDLRRPEQKRLIVERHKIISSIREFYNHSNFIEIETPILTKSTPEGARDFLVPSSINAGKYYSLPQSPQLYKQLLMASGFDKYYQIARCFRDEELRSDRQPEFTQLDVERSFVTPEMIMSETEEMFKYFFEKSLNIKLKIPFKKIDYNYSIKNYGSDKPDLRYDLKIYDVTDTLKDSKMDLFSQAKKFNKSIKAIFIDENLDKKQIDFLQDIVKKSGGVGLSYYISDSNNVISGSIMKFISEQEHSNLQKIKQHKSILIIVDKEDKALSLQGIIRYHLGRILNLVKNDEFNFVWIVNWPLLKKENNTYKSYHHPFTSPEDNYENLRNAKSKAYDITLNGTEIGGGSIRINDKKLQNQIFEILGLSKSQIESQFGFFLNAFDYAIPPHGGIALGIDRIISLIFNTNSIRDVIAFPKNSQGVSELELSPSIVGKEELENIFGKAKKYNK